MPLWVSPARETPTSCIHRGGEGLPHKKTGSASRFSVTLKRFLANNHGATAIEYGLIVGLIFLAVVSAIHVFAGQVTVMYNYIGTKIGQSS